MQKHTIKLLLRKNKKNKLGHHPVYIRITINRKQSFISTSYYIHKSHWDEKNERVKDAHPLAASINNDIIKKKKEVMDNLFNASIQNPNLTASAIKELTVMGEDRTCIFSFAERYKKEVEGKREKSTLDNWGTHLKKLEDFNGSRKLDFQAITKDFLTSFEIHLRGASVDRVKGRNPNNYIHAIMKTIKTLFNAARKAELINNYPFKNYEMPKPTPGKKQRLTLAELDKWEEFVRGTKVKRYKECGAWFLFGCYTGLRVSDWHNFDEESVHKDYISIEAIKNKERVAIPIHERLKRALDMVRVTPLKKRRQEINLVLKEICEELEIKKSISSHCARHSYAITMCAERGISAETCAKLMGITVSVCVSSYYRVTPEKIRNETTIAWSGL